jgi:hypothetical protein
MQQQMPMQPASTPLKTSTIRSQTRHSLLRQTRLLLRREALLQPLQEEVVQVVGAVLQVLPLPTALPCDLLLLVPQPKVQHRALLLLSHGGKERWEEAVKGRSEEQCEEAVPSLPSLRHNRKPSSYLPQLLHLHEEA